MPKTERVRYNLSLILKMLKLHIKGRKSLRRRAAVRRAYFFISYFKNKVNVIPAKSALKVGNVCQVENVCVNYRGLGRKRLQGGKHGVEKYARGC